MARVALPPQGAGQVNDGTTLVLSALSGAGIVAIVVVFILAARGHFVRFRRVDDPLARRVDELTLEVVELRLLLSEVMVGSALNIAQLEGAGLTPVYRLPKALRRRPATSAADESGVAQFHRLLIEHFSREELAALAFGVGIPDEGYEGDTRPALALSLVQYASRHGLISRLLGAARRERPEVEWPAVVGSRD